MDHLGARGEAGLAPDTAIPIGGVLRRPPTPSEALPGELYFTRQDLPAVVQADSMSASPGTIYFVIPTLNEHANLEDLVRGINRSMGGQPYGILIVDDGSTDGTRELILSLKQSGYPLGLLDRCRKLGIGSAVREGLEWCLRHTDADRLITMDADLSHDPGEIPKLLLSSSDAELIQGSRYIPGGHILNWGWSRRILSLLANSLVNVLLRTGMKEHTTYFRIYSRQAAEAAIRAEGCDSYEWGLASLLEILSVGLAIKEVPITFRERERGASKLTSRAMIGWLRYVLVASLANQHRANILGRLLRFVMVRSGVTLVSLTMAIILGTSALLALGLGSYLARDAVAVAARSFTNFTGSSPWA